MHMLILCLYKIIYICAYNLRIEMFPPREDMVKS